MGSSIVNLRVQGVDGASKRPRFTPSPLAFPAKVYVFPNHCLSLCQLSFSFIALMSSEFILFY